MAYTQGNAATKQPIKALLHFDGQWRTYQKRVLDESENYLKDKKIHIVAAPGSGKTTLGIELIRRLNAPALILSPSINIRDQWIKRVQEAFLTKGMDTTGILSNSVREPALITAITYQALHSCINEDFFQTVKKAGIRTLCLDEAHHLRSEWWKALEELVKREPQMTIISLTATPPYDSTKTEWDRYIGLCGPIDEEIIVPELVKEGSLCPHQDYVYFNMPTAEEEKEVTVFRKTAVTLGEQIYMDEEFTRLVSTHAGVRNPSRYADKLLDNPEYLSSLIVFLNAKNLPISGELVRMLGAKEKIPSMNLHWLEVLLQGFLYDDTDSFSSTAEYREQMISFLKGYGLIRKNEVCFTFNEEVNKLLIQSKGKIRSIVKIVGEEYKNLGSELRLLILTDFIKKEYLSALGAEDVSVNELGVVPIFENIRREYEKAQPSPEELRLAALSGSVVIIPEAAKELLQSIMEEKNVKGSIRECGATGYYQVTVSGTEETASGLVTELFNQGAIRVLIGTKSLLGEGWDSPCINSLILASFVGSFMLSNQMRGRAIRTMKGNPGKVSNIWHLICMEPESSHVTKGTMKSAEESEDFATLKRRFEGFMGVHYEKNVIENGLDRLSYIKPPYTAPMLEKINEQMLAMAADRQGLKKRWEESMDNIKKMDVAVEAGADNEYFKPGIALFNGLCKLIVAAVAVVLCLMNVVIPVLTHLITGKKIGVLLIAGLAVTAVCLRFLFRYGTRVASMATPFKYMQSIGKGVLQALQDTGNIQSRGISVKVDDTDGLTSYLYLSGGTEREKDVFSQCIYEMFGVVDNQRYLLKSKKTVQKLCKYYCVPELFGKKKEDAELFQKSVEKYIGPYELIYTRNPEGRRVLLDARVNSFANKTDRVVNKRKQVKSAWQ